MINTSSPTKMWTHAKPSFHKSNPDAFNNSFGLELHRRKTKPQQAANSEAPTYAASHSNLNPTPLCQPKTKPTRNPDKQRKQR
ncbi:hypothetical protein [Dasania marina]|uniref:hypothetical protein n=1 Tax=Dasania marina TaxID=471499 RepID=UPI00036C22F2|nr:hypothetical protein [Dasania marina]